MKAALYHRVSTVDQDEYAAARELRAAAGRLELEVALEVTETGSGANNDRPGLQRVLEAARRGQVDAILCWKLDRFGRSALDLLGHLRELESAGVRFLATSQGIDLRPGGDAMSRLLLTMLAAVAEFERQLIRERTRLGLDAARRRGKVLGRPSVPRPPAARVRELRRRLTWKDTAAELGCSVWAARAALAEELVWEDDDEPVAAPARDVAEAERFASALARDLVERSPGRAKIGGRKRPPDAPRSRGPARRRRR